MRLPHHGPRDNVDIHAGIAHAFCDVLVCNIDGPVANTTLTKPLMFTPCRCSSLQRPVHRLHFGCLFGCVCSSAMFCIAAVNSFFYVGHVYLLVQRLRHYSRLLIIHSIETADLIRNQMMIVFSPATFLCPAVNKGFVLFCFRVKTKTVQAQTDRQKEK